MLLRRPSARGDGLKRLAVLPLIGVLLIGAAACRAPAGSSPEIALDWRIAPAPPSTGPATLTLNLSESGGPVEGAEVKVEGNMAHPGMAPVLAEAREVSPGHYESTLQLSMAGDWIVLVDARLRDGRAVHRELQVRGVRAP